MHLRTLTIIFVFFLFMVPTNSQRARALAATSPSVQTHGEIIYYTNGTQPLRTSGTTIVDGNGTRVILKGFTLDWNEWKKGYFTIEDLQTIKAHGGNIVEYQSLEFSGMVNTGTIDESYFANTVDKLVSLAEGLQVYHIINMFNLGSTDKQLYNLNDVSSDNLRQNFVNLWMFIANRYKNDSYAIFSPMNEPFNGAGLAASDYSNYGQWYSTFLGQVVSAIRSTGANQLVFIDVPYVGDYSNVHPVSGSGVVWEDHDYVTPSFGINQWTTYMSNTVISKFVGDFQRPLYIGEYGPYPHDMTDWSNILSQQATYLKNSVVAGYAYHTYGVLAGEWYNIFDNSDSEYILQTVLK